MIIYVVLVVDMFGDDNHPSNAQKWQYTLMTTVIFLVVSAPFTQKVVQSLLGGVVKVAAANGCPTAAGLLIHAVVFTLILRAMMGL